LGTEKQGCDVGPEQRFSETKDEMLAERKFNEELQADEDSGQMRKWVEFLQGDIGKFKLEGLDLLKAMEHSDEEMEDSETEMEERKELSSKVVDKIICAREKEPRMGLCDQGKLPKQADWGPVLVERKRRGNNHGESMLQKAMNLKKKKNLEPLKGNSFAPLQAESLSILSRDINIKIGNDLHDNESIIDNLIKAEQKRYNDFVGENPEVLLPTSIDLDIEVVRDPLKGQERPNISSPNSMKETNTADLWTEVVRKGRNRAKTKSRSDKIGVNDRCILEY
jgi:hypothetical protein